MITVSEEKEEFEMSNLTAYIRDCWEAANRAKLPVTDQMQHSLGQRNGLYTAGKLQAIKKTGGSELYMLLTKSKCRDAEAWLKDILIQPGLRPWDLTPCNTDADEAHQDAIFEAVDRIRDCINDQFIEGGWYRAFEELLYDLVTFKAGFIKGPILRRERTRRRVLNAGVWETVIEERILAEFERRSPFDIYPAPDSTGIDDSYLIDVIRLRPAHLMELIGVPGFNEDAIRRVLSGLKDGTIKGYDDVYPGVTGADVLGFKRIPEGKLTLLEFWGNVEGWMLSDYLNVDGSDAPGGVSDPRLKMHSCPVCVWVVGDQVLKVMANPDPMGLKPYSKVSFEEVPGQFWGVGLAEVLEGVQSACNAVGRAIVNNAGLASGPQVERNIERVIPGESREMWPWKVWDVTDTQMTSTPAIRFYQPPMVVDKLIGVYEFFIRRAEEHSGIPSYVNSSTRDTAVNTNASALSMSMTQAARGIKGVVKNIDSRIITPCVERQYYFNLQYGDDSALSQGSVPDVKVVAKGSSSLIAKEQQAIRRSEFLRSTNNPVDMAIIGEDGRRHLLKEVARALEIDVEKVIPDAPQSQPLKTDHFAPYGSRADIKTELSQGTEPGAARPSLTPIAVAPTPDKKSGKSLNPAGEPHGDFNLFNGAGIE
ncbi:MAG: hypothetical protein HQL05_04470 [Nitrospirae bacterium]|nr:hypothetical protein [Nitrospirota bacterium]